MSLYQKLYPKLNILQNKPEPRRSMGVQYSSGILRSRSEPTYKNIQTLQKVIEPTTPKKVEFAKLPKPDSPKVLESKVPEAPLASEIIAPKVMEAPVVVENLEANVSTEPPKPKLALVPKKVEKRPKDRLKMDKPELADTIIPEIGTKGFQKKYSFDQRKKNYMERLARKSVKNAELEIDSVNQVLDTVGANPTALREEEVNIRKRLKLINYAKFFAEDKKDQSEPEQFDSEGSE